MRSILITGSNRGIGLGLIKALVQHKNQPEKIIATCRKPEEAKELQDWAERNKNIHILNLDVTDFESYPSLVERATGILNDGLNVLVNNAGVPGKYARLGFLKPEHMLETYTINTVAPTILTKAFIPLLRQSSEANSDKPLGCHRAAVINMSSILGSISKNEEGGYYTYRTSKAALNAVTRSLSIDLRSSNILITSLHPGWVKTSMGGPKAPTSIEEASQNILNFLYNLSEDHNGHFFNSEGSEIPW